MSSRQRENLFDRIHPRVRALAADHELALALADLDHCASLVGYPKRPAILAATQAMQDARPGQAGAQSYDSPSVSGGGSSSPVERAAVGTTCLLCDQPNACKCANQKTNDPTQGDRALLDSLLVDLWTDVRGAILEPDEVCKRITRNALALRRLIESWTPHAPTDKQRTAVARANDPEAECAHHRTFGSFEPVHRTTDGQGLLSLPTPLCRFCYDRLRTDGRLPSADRMQRLAQGRSDRVPVPK